MSSEIKMWSDPFWNLRNTSKILKDMGDMLTGMLRTVCKIVAG